MGRTALFTAVSHNHAAIAFALLAVGADVNPRCGPLYWSVVHVEAQNGFLNILRAAIEHGDYLEARDREKKPACHVAGLRTRRVQSMCLWRLGPTVSHSIT